MNIDTRIIEQFNKNNKFFNLEDAKLISLCKIGSHSHGTYIPNSDPNSIDDIDYMGIVLPPASHTFGLDACSDKRWQSTVFKFEELDCVFYSLQHYIKLISYKRNPNVLGLVWLNPEMYVHTTSIWNELVWNRHLFSCKNSLETFRGTAKSHFQKMKGDGAYQGYMGEKRKVLVDKYGYDVKDAAHAIRLLQMGIDFYDTCRLIVDRTDLDADMLKDIKTGKHSLNYIIELWNILDDMIGKAHAATLLPDDPNYAGINELVEKITLAGYGLDYWDFSY